MFLRKAKHFFGVKPGQDPPRLEVDEPAIGPRQKYPAQTPNVNTSETPAASSKREISETLEALNAKAAIGQSFLLTNTTSQRGSVDRTTPESSTPQPYHKDGQKLIAEENGDKRPLSNQSPSAIARGKDREKQTEGNFTVPMGLSTASMSDKLHNEESPGSSSLNEQINEYRKFHLTKNSPGVQPSSTADNLDHGQEAGTEVAGPAEDVGHQITAPHQASLYGDQGNKLLPEEAPTSDSAVTVQKPVTTAEARTSDSAVTVQKPVTTAEASIPSDTGNVVRVGNLWVLPERPLQYPRLNIYNKKLKPSVDWLLQFSKGSTQPQGETAFAEILIAKRNKSDDFGPTVVFGSRVPKRRQQIEKFLKDGELSGQLLKFGLSWSIEDADESSIYFLGSLYMNQSWVQASKDQTERRFNVDIGFLPTETKVCGARILIYGENHDDDSRRSSMAMMTLGGIIIVDDKPYGLTVAHPVSMIAPQKSDKPGFEANWESSHDVRNILGEKHDRNIFTSYEDFTEQLYGPRTHLFRSLGSISAMAYSNQLGSINVPQNSDWMLVSIELDMMVPNLVQGKLSSSPQLIQDIVTQAELSTKENATAELPCTVVTAHGAIQARLSHDSSMLEIGGSSFQAKRVGLDHPLGRGDSGSWVLFEGRLCGSIIAGRDHPPYAYMVPIEDVFNSIMTSMKASRVSLPSEIDSRLFELNLAARKEGSLDAAIGYPEILLLRAYKQQHSGASRPIHDPVLRREDLLMFSSAMQGQNLLREVYDHLTGSDLSTLNGLTLLGDLCPLKEEFLSQQRDSILRRTLRVSLNPRLREIRSQIFKTRAGENLLALLYFTNWMPIPSQAALFSELLELLNVPYSLIPSASRIQKLVRHCRSLLSYSQLRPDSMLVNREPGKRDDLSRFSFNLNADFIRNQAYLILQLAQVVKWTKSKILISGGSRLEWVPYYASSGLGLSCAVYTLQSGGGYQPSSRQRFYPRVKDDEKVQVHMYFGSPSQVCELLDSPPSSALRSLDMGLNSTPNDYTRESDQHWSIAGPSTKEEPKMLT
ncbi:hypothetical protein MMC11_000928 [Xylographa trunciseda]|nr:hypothetical protein [Xylographa trunciseda]